MNECSECRSVDGCTGPPTLPRQINRVCAELTDAGARYAKQADQGHDVDWSKGVEMGMALALDFLHQWTHGQYGAPLEPRKVAS